MQMISGNTLPLCPCSANPEASGVQRSEHGTQDGHQEWAQLLWGGNQERTWRPSGPAGVVTDTLLMFSNKLHEGQNTNQGRTVWQLKVWLFSWILHVNSSISQAQAKLKYFFELQLKTVQRKRSVPPKDLRKESSTKAIKWVTKI